MQEEDDRKYTGHDSSKSKPTQSRTHMRKVSPKLMAQTIDLCSSVSEGAPAVNAALAVLDGLCSVSPMHAQLKANFAVSKLKNKFSKQNLQSCVFIKGKIPVPWTTAPTGVKF